MGGSSRGELAALVMGGCSVGGIMTMARMNAKSWGY